LEFLIQFVLLFFKLNCWYGAHKKTSKSTSSIWTYFFFLSN